MSFWLDRALEKSLDSAKMKGEGETGLGERGAVDVGPGVAHVLVVHDVEDPAEETEEKHHQNVFLKFGLAQTGRCAVGGEVERR